MVSAQRRLGHLDPARPQVGDRGHGGDLDLLLGQEFDVAQQAVLARFGEGDRHPFAAGPAGAADPMDVRLGRGGHVVVHHVRHVLDVEPARGHVGGDEQVGGVGAELLHHAIALLLRQPAMQRFGPIAPAVERLAEFVDLGTRAAEDDGRGGVLHVEDAAEGRHLVRAADHVGDLPDSGRRTRGHHFTIDANPHRVLEVLVRDLGDARRESGGEERGLPFLRRLVEDRLEVLREAHVEHLVGFVEDDHLDARKPQALAADVIEGAAGSGDHDVHPALAGRATASPWANRRRWARR